MSKIKLTKLQKDVLIFFAQNEFGKNFYWTGGTLLAYHYLNHRSSEDLDFFSNDLYINDEYLIFINQLKKELKIKQVKYRLNKNRRQYLVKKGKQQIKLELVYFPFDKLERGENIKEFNLSIDSLTDIMVNKILSTYQRQEIKDVYDLYFYLNHKPKYSLLRLIKLCQKKFGVEIEPILLLAKINELIKNLNPLKPMLISPPKNLDQKMKKYFQDIFNQIAKKELR